LAPTLLLPFDNYKKRRPYHPLHRPQPNHYNNEDGTYSSPKQQRKDYPVSNQRTSLRRNRDYLFLLSGQAISSMGTEVSDLAYILLVLALTGSAAQVGFVGALEAAPVLVLSMPARGFFVVMAPSTSAFHDIPGWFA